MQGIDSRRVVAVISEVTHRLDQRQPLNEDQAAIANALVSASLVLTKLGIRAAREARRISPLEMRAKFIESCEALADDAATWIDAGRRVGWITGPEDNPRLTPEGRGELEAPSFRVLHDSALASAWLDADEESDREL